MGYRQSCLAGIIVMFLFFFLPVLIGGNFGTILILVFILSIVNGAYQEHKRQQNNKDNE